MIHYLTNVRYLSGYKLQLTFEGKYIREVDLEQHLDGEIFEPLRDVSYFKTVHINPDIETVVWDNGADYAPEFLFEISAPVAEAASAA